VWVPPVDERVKLLPSVPVTVTCVALVAVTVRVEELPVVMEVGFAAMVTVGALGATTVTIAVAVAVPPVPVAVAV
jgi:hypothetical protein